MTATSSKRSPARRRVDVVPVADKLRWSLSEAAALCGLSENYVRELIGKGEFPPRVHVRASDDDDGGKLQFCASEVRAWADGRDWRSMVAARQGGA